MKYVKKLFLLAVIPMLSIAIHAQDTAGDNTPQKNNFTVAASVGYNSYMEITALPGYLTEYEVAALSTDWTNKKMTVGIEAGWFFTNLWKLKLGGGLSFTANPGYAPLLGTVDSGSQSGDLDIPDYLEVAQGSTLNYRAFLGVDRYFRTKVKNLMPYVGLRADFAHSYNHQKRVDDNSLGKSIAEGFSLGGALSVGTDYFVLPGMYVGIQIDLGAFTYHKSSYKPQEGLGSLSADSYNFGALAAPTLKLGFKF